MPCQKHAADETTHFKSSDTCYACFMQDTRQAIFNIELILAGLHSEQDQSHTDLQSQITQLQHDLFSIIPEEPEPNEPSE